MDHVKIDLTNCYGIKRLQHAFDFSKTPAYAIYAPNGVMKSSLARTFQDAANRRDSEDRIFPDRKAKRSITDETGAEIDGERVLVVLPYDPDLAPTQKTSTLLVNAKLRKEYEELHVAINEAKAMFLKAVKQQAGSKKDFEEEISSAFTKRADSFDNAVTRIKPEMQKQKDTPFADVQYDVIFNEKVLKALEAADLREAIDDYIRRYNGLLDKSIYFKKGTFDYYSAGQIAKSLADHGFFEAKHTVNLKDGSGTLEITTEKELEAVIAKEKEAIITDKELRKNFDAVQKKLEKNAELREFCRYLQANEPLLSRMNNLGQFKEDILKSYIKTHEELYLNLMNTLESAEKRINEIHAEAAKERTQWEEVIAIFKERFTVPFELETQNRTAVMLGNEPIVKLGFIYKDGEDRKQVAREELVRVLSTGERKALYVLNVIFEVQRRIKDGIETLMVVDDIADSFDYQNKYAIIQYLRDISQDGRFKLIIMSHNFDFFRTIESRFVGYSNCLMASRNKGGISLVKATGIRNVFGNDWKPNFFKDSKKKIASIPFLRNLVEMTVGEDDPKFQTLTSMLHWKEDTGKLTVGDLDAIFNTICETKKKSANTSALVCDLIIDAANDSLKGGDGLNLENKIVLAIAIRIIAEKYMIERIADPKFVASITSNQTQRLIEKYREKFPSDDAPLKVLDRVALMTPENIHVNSFMYEPIIDMSDDHLRKLYEDVSALEKKSKAHEAKTGTG